MFFLPQEVTSKVFYLQKLEKKFFFKSSWFQLISLKKLFAVERVFKKFDHFFLERNIIMLFKLLPTWTKKSGTYFPNSLRFKLLRIISNIFPKCSNMSHQDFFSNIEYLKLKSYLRITRCDSL